MNRPALNYVGNEWAQLKEWLDEELLDVYHRLANVQASEAETQQLRGRASLISQMLDFPNNPAANYRPR